MHKFGDLFFVQHYATVYQEWARSLFIEIQESICAYLGIYEKRKSETHSNSVKSWRSGRGKGNNGNADFSGGEEWEGRKEKE